MVGLLAPRYTKNQPKNVIRETTWNFLYRRRSDIMDDIIQMLITRIMK